MMVTELGGLIRGSNSGGLDGVECRYTLELVRYDVVRPTHEDMILLSSHWSNHQDKD